MYDVSQDVDALLNEPFVANNHELEYVVENDTENQNLEALSDKNILLHQPQSENSSINRLLSFTKKFFNIIAFIAAALVAIIMLLVISWDDMRIYFNSLNFDSPKERFVNAEMKSAEQMADTVSSLYGQWYSRNCSELSGYEADIHILLSDDAANKLNDYLPEKNQTDLSWIDDISLSANINRDRFLYQISTKTSFQGNGLFNTNYILDMSKLLLWVQYPELSDSYLQLGINEIYEEFYGNSLEPYAIDKDAYTQLVASLPSEQILNQLLMKYYTLAIEQVEDIEQEKTVLSSGEISVKCTALTATISEKQLINISVNILEALRQDELILGMLEDFAKAKGLDPDAERTAFISKITGKIGDLHQSAEQANPKNHLKWILYVDNHDNLLGRKICISGVDKQFYTYTIIDENEFAYYFDLFETVQIKGCGSRFESVIDAEFDVSLDGVPSFHVIIDDLNFIKFLNKNLSGKITLQPTDKLIKQWYGNDYHSKLLFVIDLETTKLENNFRIDIIKDEAFIAGFTFSGKDLSGKPFGIPDSFIEITNDAAFGQWLENVQFDKLKTNFKKANLPTALTNALEEYLNNCLISLQG